MAHVNTAETARSRALRNFGFSGACKAVTAMSSLAVSVITARSLGASDMGTFSFVVWVAGTVAALSSLGLPDAAAKYFAEQKGAGNHALAAMIARRIIAVQILAAGIASLIGAGVWLMFSRHYLILVFLALAAVMPAALQQMLLALMEGAQSFHLQLIATFGGAVFQVGIVAAVAMRHGSILGFLLANLLSSVVFTALTLFLCRPILTSYLEPGPHIGFPEISKRVFDFSLSVYALSLLSLVVFDKSELFVLRIFQKPAELAYYSIAFGLTARLATAGDSISYVLFPIFVTRFTQNGSEDLCKVYRQSMRYLQLFMVPIIAWSIPLAPRLMVFVYGSQYAHVGPVVQVLLATMLLTVMLTVSASAIFTLDKQSAFLRYMLVVAALNILLDLVLISRYGALGAAFANGISQAIAVCGLIALLWRALPGSIPVLASMKIYFAAIVSAASIFYAEFAMRAGALVLCISVGAAVLIYIGLLGGLGEVTTAELKAFADSVKMSLSRTEG
jgi:O-antigen/teichoic acid export membrane protein